MSDEPAATVLIDGNMSNVSTGETEQTDLHESPALDVFASRLNGIEVHTSSESPAATTRPLLHSLWQDYLQRGDESLLAAVHDFFAIKHGN